MTAPAEKALAPEAGEPTLGDKIGFAAMVVGLMMAVLDIQVVSSSLAEIQAGLSVSRDKIAWVQTSYLIAEIIMIPLSGWFAHVLSTRVLFVASATSFTLASIACAFAWNLNSIIVFRALQGFLGGAMIPTVFSSIFIFFPSGKRTTASVFVGLVATTAPTLGPILGGWLTAVLSWRWLFLINVIPGALVALTVWFKVHIDRPNLSLLKGFDVAGIALCAVFLGSLEFVLEEGAGENWFESRKIVVFAILAALGGAAFLWRELTASAPVVDLRAFGDRNFSLGCAYSFIIGVTLYGSIFLLSVYLASVNGYNSLQIGWVMMVAGGFQFLSAPMAGALSRTLAPRVMLAIGLLCLGAGFYMSRALTADWGYREFFAPQALRGFSVMFLFMPVNMIALGALPPEKLKGASGLYNLMRNLGGAIGLATLNTVVNQRRDLHYAHIAETVTAARGPAADALSGGGALAADPDSSLRALSVLTGVAQREATVMAFSDAFLLLALTVAVGFLLMPLMKTVESDGGPARGSH